MKTADVVIRGGDQTAELIPVGHEHEDALQDETHMMTGILSASVLTETTGEQGQILTNYK